MRKWELFGKILLGNFLLAFSVNMFILPFHFISGGATGLALILQRIIPLPFSWIATGINVSMFFLGLVALGRVFALTTLLSTCVYPLFLQLTSTVSELFTLTQDPLIACVVAGALMGLGLGLVIQSGASTGGMDIPPLVLEKKWGIKVSVSLYCMDTALLLIQMLFSSPNGILCGLLLVLTTSFVLNQILTLGKTQCQVVVISSKYEALREAFLKELDRGVTLFCIETGYYQQSQRAICSIVAQNELRAVQAKVQSIDAQAFMIVSKVQEVRGLGFKPWSFTGKEKLAKSRNRSDPKKTER